MTLPVERARSVKETENFLYDLLDPKKTPNVPKKIRERASRLLRHYPRELDIKLASKKVPDIFKVE